MEEKLVALGSLVILIIFLGIYPKIILRPIKCFSYKSPTNYGKEQSYKN